MIAKNGLIVILINLVIFGIIELFSLSSLDVMTPARIFVHVGFIVNVILLVMTLANSKKM